MSKRWRPARDWASNFSAKAALTNGTWLEKDKATALGQYKGHTLEAQHLCRVTLAGCRGQCRPYWPKSPSHLSFHASLILILALLSTPPTNSDFIIPYLSLLASIFSLDPGSDRARNSPVFKSMPLWQLSAPVLSMKPVKPHSLLELTWVHCHSLGLTTGKPKYLKLKIQWFF